MLVSLSPIVGELALQGCTVHVYDHSPLTVQTVHSTVARQLDELRQAALLTEEHSLRVRAAVFVKAHRKVAEVPPPPPPPHTPSV